MSYSKFFENKFKTWRLQFLIHGLFQFIEVSQKKKICFQKTKVFSCSFLYQSLYFCFSKKKFFFRFLFERFLCFEKTTVNPLRKKNPLYFIQRFQQHPTFLKTTCQYKLPNQISFLNWLSKQKWIKYIVKALRID